MAKYVHDDFNNRIESMSKEEIYALIDEVIESGELPTEAQTAFVTALKSIVDGKPYKIGLCTQAEYNELVAQGELVEDALYIITDDTSYDDLMEYLDNAIASMQADLNAKPYTSELMQEEAAIVSSEDSPNYITIPLNDMSNINNYVEVTGFIASNANATGAVTYFTHRTKATDLDEDPAQTSRGQSILADLGNFPIDQTDIAKVETYLKKGGSGYSGYRLDAHIYNIGATTVSKLPVYLKIVSVKELINY